MDENQILKRQVEMMAEWIFDNTFDEICKQTIQTNNCDEYTHCIDCIKEYFQEEVLIECIKEKFKKEN